jgi:hypothetical protein
MALGANGFPTELPAESDRVFWGMSVGLNPSDRDYTSPARVRFRASIKVLRPNATDEQIDDALRLCCVELSPAGILANLSACVLKHLDEEKS